MARSARHEHDTLAASRVGQQGQQNSKSAWYAPRIPSERTATSSPSICAFVEFGTEVGTRRALSLTCRDFFRHFVVTQLFLSSNPGWRFDLYVKATE